MQLPDSLSRVLCPRDRTTFRMKDEVIADQIFQDNLAEAMLGWQQIRSFEMETLEWWEVIVKPGVKRLAMLRGKQMTKISKEELNLLLVRQAYLNKKVKNGQHDRLGELRTVHSEIQLLMPLYLQKLRI